jgi:hypothetical protein
MTLDRLRELHREMTLQAMNEAASSLRDEMEFLAECRATFEERMRLIVKKMREFGLHARSPRQRGAPRVVDIMKWISGEASIADIANKSGFGKTAIYRHLQEALKEKKIKKIRHGVYVKI